MKQLLFLPVVFLACLDSTAQSDMRIYSQVKPQTSVLVDGNYFSTIKKDSLQGRDLNIPLSAGMHQVVFIKKDFGQDILVFNSENYTPVSEPSMQLLAGLTMLGPILRHAYIVNRVLTFE